MSSIPGPTSVCVAFFLVIVRSWWSFLFLQNKLTLAGEKSPPQRWANGGASGRVEKGRTKDSAAFDCVCVHVWLASRCRGNSTVNLHDREKPECLCYTDTNETQSIKTIKTRVLFFLASVFAGDGFLCRSVLIISLHISDIGTGLHPWCVCVCVTEFVHVWSV